MSWQLTTAAVLTFLLAAAHSVLGERFIIARLIRRDQPKLFGSDAFTKRTLRFAWHVTTLFAWALAAVLLLDPSIAIQWVIAGAMVITAMVTLVISRAQHLSWVVELAIAGLIGWNLLTG